MKAIMVMFDTLNRRFLQPYGCDWTHTPNFQRLAEKTITFDHSYVGSMPCMPARRDLHTGRLNFLHRSWGPLEPYDESCIAKLKNNGVYTHMVTDHQHYWEEGAGGNYLSKYNTHQMVRGQEGDPYYGQIIAPPIPENAASRNAQDSTWNAIDRINRSLISGEDEMPQAKTFHQGLDFIERHADQDNWFIQIETFDPHEPFFTLPEYKNLYAEYYEKSRDMLFDWPGYSYVNETPEEVEHLRHNYACLLSMCDVYMGKVLDLMDEKNLWEDTMLTVWTDHGFLLGEHDCWAKCWVPFYDEVAHTPLFMWDPRVGKAGERRQSLVQPCIDLAPTLLDYFGLENLKHATGKNLLPVLESDSPVRDTALFGIHGGHVNITDGRYVYMAGPSTPDNSPLFNYTLMPAHMRSAFGVKELQDIEMAAPFDFTQGCKTMKITAGDWGGSHRHQDGKKTMLFDLENDPGQLNPVTLPDVESGLRAAMVEHMKSLDAPIEQYERLGL